MVLNLVDQLIDHPGLEKNANQLPVPGEMLIIA